MISLLSQQILAMRASAMAIAATADAMLAAMQPALPTEDACLHPVTARALAPRMGAPEAWICVCGQEGDA